MHALTDKASESATWFRYRREGDVTLIELKLLRVEQLFNSLDPSPFHEKDLDREAEAYIVDSLRDLQPRTPVKLVVYLPAESMIEPEAKAAPDAIRHYFSYCHAATVRRLRLLLREGRATLLLGLVFLFSCIALRQIFLRAPLTTFGGILNEGLLILGWVAMWRPVETLLYDWWPVRRLAHIYRQLATIDVELRSREQMPAARNQRQSSAVR